MPAPTFQNIINFRDVAESVNGLSHQKLLKCGLLFRGGRPDEATASDREQLVKGLGVKTIVDLRSNTEIINAAKRQSAAAALVEPAVVPTPDALVADPLRISGTEHVRINVSGKGFERSLLWKLSYFSIAKLGIFMALGYRDAAIGIVIREVLEPRGLVGLSMDTVDYSGPEIKELFELLANKESWPVMIHCAQGKDRTGTAVILVLLLCGVDIDTITSDYVLSEAGIAGIEQRTEISDPKMKESLSKCPKELPSKLQDHIKEKYGNIDGYLQHIGVDESQLQTIRSILLDQGCE